MLKPECNQQRVRKELLRSTISQQYLSTSPLVKLESVNTPTLPYSDPFKRIKSRWWVILLINLYRNNLSSTSSKCQCQQTLLCHLTADVIQCDVLQVRAAACQLYYIDVVMYILTCFIQQRVLYTSKHWNLPDYIITVCTPYQYLYTIYAYTTTNSAHTPNLK